MIVRRFLYFLSIILFQLIIFHFSYEHDLAINVIYGLRIINMKIFIFRISEYFHFVSACVQLYQFMLFFLLVIFVIGLSFLLLLCALIASTCNAELTEIYSLTQPDTEA